jgi:ribonuclease P protein component
VSGVRNTIKSTDEISSLFKTAQRVSTRSFVALVKRADEGRGLCGRVAFIAGKRLGSAPKRNKAKRLMREAARTTKIPWPGIDVIFVARDGTASVSLGAMVGDMERVKRQAARKSIGAVPTHKEKAVSEGMAERTTVIRERT